MPADKQIEVERLLQTVSDVLFPADLEPRKVTLESVNVDGDTPLHIFLWRNDEHAARLLVEHGANVNAVGDMGETPLHVAMRAATAETIAVLLAAGARTDVVSEFGQTPLQLAEERDRQEVVKQAQRQAKEMAREARLRRASGREHR